MYVCIYTHTTKKKIYIEKIPDNSERKRKKKKNI